MSPTYSQLINTVSLSNEDFEINKDLLRKDFYSEVNKKMRVWFFSKVLKDIRTLYQEEFYTYLRQEKRTLSIGSGLNSSNKRNIQITLVSVSMTHPQKLRYGKLVTILS